MRTELEMESIKIRFEELSRPLIKFINENYHPHVKIIIHSSGAEILEGIVCTPEIVDYIYN